MARSLVTLLLLPGLAGCPRSDDALPATSRALPEQGTRILLDTGEVLLAIDPEGGAALRWEPAPAAALSEVLARPHVLLGERALAFEGLAQALPLPARGFDAALSPDGKTLAYALEGAGGSASLRLVEVDGGGDRPLTDQGAEPRWLADGALVLRDGDASSGRNVVEVRPDGSGLRLRSDGGGYSVDDLDVSPDGARVVFAGRRAGATAGETAGALLLAQDGQTRPIFEAGSGGDVYTPRFSPDGQQIGFLARRPSRGEARQPTTLYVLGPDGEARPVLDLEAAPPSLLGLGGATSGVRRWAWSPDGAQLAMVAAMAGDCRANPDGALICDYDLYVVGADGEGLRRLTELRLAEVPALAWVN